MPMHLVPEARETTFNRSTDDCTTPDNNVHSWPAIGLPLVDKLLNFSKHKVATRSARSPVDFSINILSRDGAKMLRINTSYQPVTDVDICIHL